MTRAARRWLPASSGLAGLVLLAATLPVNGPGGSAAAPAAAAAAPLQEAVIVPLAEAIPPGDRPGRAGVPSQVGRGTGASGDAASLGPGAGVAAGGTLPGMPVAARCVGDPPRQTFSAYAAPCAAPFAGDNGGATAPGVTATDVRWAVIAEHTSYDGLVPTTAQPGETAADRTYRVLQEWFNRNYQLYGRRLQLVAIRADRYDENAQLAAVTAARDQYHAFGLLEPGYGAIDLGPARGLVTFATYSLPRSYYLARAPYLWNVDMDYTTSVELASELVCTKLAGQRAAFTDDPVLSAVPARRFGVIYYDDIYLAGNGPGVRDEVARRCGEEVVLAGYRIDDPASVATAVARLRQGGVTSVVFFGDFFVAAQILRTATAQGYFPEWVVPGQGGVEDNSLAATFPPEQWRHAFGISPREVPLDPSATEWWQAYREIDPAADPDPASAEFLWRLLTQVANGMQAAGPDLSVTGFAVGLYGLGHRPQPAAWATGGGYGPADFTYVDDVAEVWWDPQALAYRYTRDGRRFRPGELDADTSRYFQEGITRADR